MSQIFPLGIKVGKGSQYATAIKFNKDDTGFYSANDKSIGVAITGDNIMSYRSDHIEILKQLKLSSNPKENAVLYSDKNGMTTWKMPHYSGSTRFASVYDDFNFNSPNNSINIQFPETFDVKSVQLTKECEFAVDDIELYIKNKSSTGFTLYSNKPVSNVISTDVMTNFSSCKLGDDRLGVCYYQYNTDSIVYTHTDKDCKSISNYKISTESALEVCDICEVDDVPAVVYITDNSSDAELPNEIKYVKALDAKGTAWAAAEIVLSITNDIMFSADNIRLLELDGKPAVFLNNGVGRAQVIIKDNGLWVPTNISNLDNHQILDVKKIDGRAHVIARSNVTNNLYFAKSDVTGKIWPIGAKGIYTDILSLTHFQTNNVKCNTLCSYNNILYIISSGLANSNAIFLSRSFDNGETWENIRKLTDINTSISYSTLFSHNNKVYLLYNSYTGHPTQKNIIDITNPNDINVRSFISTLNLATDHTVQKIDGINLILLASSSGLVLTRFYDDDFLINWHAT